MFFQPFMLFGKPIKILIQDMQHCHAIDMTIQHLVAGAEWLPYSAGIIISKSGFSIVISDMWLLWRRCLLFECCANHADKN
jgi:hypothetical protein